MTTRQASRTVLPKIRAGLAKIEVMHSWRLYRDRNDPYACSANESKAAPIDGSLERSHRGRSG